jgi:GNAT superfamily N-acetyltransferase
MCNGYEGERIMILRLAKEADYASLMELYNAFVGMNRYSNHDNDSFMRVLKNPNNHVHVAEENGQLIGFVSFSVRDVIRYPKQIIEIDELFVSLEYRKQHVGTQLILLVEDAAKKLDCYRIFIESHYDHTVAHKFYESLGYTNYGYHFVKDL